MLVGGSVVEHVLFLISVSSELFATVCKKLEELMAVDSVFCLSISAERLLLRSSSTFNKLFGLTLLTLLT